MEIVLLSVNVLTKIPLKLTSSRVVVSPVQPRIDPFTFGESPIFAGESTQVTCFASQGDLPLDIAWSFNGEKELSTFGVSTLNAGKRGKMLVIDSVSSINKGEYICTAKNLAGTATYSAYLEIHGNHEN